MRAVLDAEQTAHTHAAQARASMVVLTLLPLPVIVFSVIGDQAVRDFLLCTRVGGALLLVGVLLDVVGFMVMSKMIGTAR